MPETIIRGCATGYCKNGFQVENEDDPQILCGQCEIEIVAQTPTPDLESEFRETEPGQRPARPEGPRIPEDPRIPKNIRMVLKAVQRARAATKEQHAPRGAAIISNISQGKIPDNLPKEVLGAAQDLAGFLDGSVPTKTNRLGALHASGWEIEQIMHLIRDLANTMNKAGEEMLPEVQIEVLGELLRMAMDITLLTRHRTNSS